MIPSGPIGVVLGALIVISFVGAALFLALYLRVSQWRVTALGRHTMWLSVLLATLTGLGVISIFAPELPGRAYIRLGSWAFLAAVLWQRVWLLLKAFQEGPAGRHRAAVEAHEQETERLAQEEN